MTQLRNSEVSNFTYSDIDMETTSVTSYSCFNYFFCSWNVISYTLDKCITFLLD